MTPEEAFDEWLHEHTCDGVLSRDIRLAEAAWLEATRQAYEKMADTWISQHGFDKHGVAVYILAVYIRQRLQQLEQGDK